MKRRQIPLLHEHVFRNISDRDMELDEVFRRIQQFMRTDPCASYQLVIGSDAQVHGGHTKFVTAIVIVRQGRGAWFCYRQVILPREVKSIQEKLSLETSFSQEIAMYFDAAKRAQLEDIIMPHVYTGAEFHMYIDIDAGIDSRRNATAPFVPDMVGRIEAMGMSARVKPEAIVASAVSDRFTKLPYRSKKKLTAEQRQPSCGAGGY
ncbi:ribonuclease H-like YkuK family protein [Paenibacillus soyae]|uniref:Ribonuclease H-like YkuK family protein n=1 Tax=Paenibacillus soyae TaxID=2969249 RepID=A0A9X2MQK2_9BACL|nr:ribonuclease H-like YkuK family protein [Paenibacillus soyae]MCR2804580.1 ribonuclease H-like YkuK family protein [Paenibacillus soyae]